MGALPDGRVHCYLCPRHCHIGEGQSGFCFIRVNRAENFTAWDMLPRPRCRSIPSRKNRSIIFFRGHESFLTRHGGLQHGLLFLPELGYLEIEIGSGSFHHMPPEDVSRWRPLWMPSIAFTYNEPTIWGEYVIDICHAARKHGFTR